MSKLKSAILVLAAMLIIQSSTVWAGDPCTFEVHYVPLEMEFYVPPTPEHIVENGDEYVVYSEAICRIYMGIMDKPSEVPVGDSFKRIRIRIHSINSSKVFYLTADKEVVDEDFLYTVDEELFSEAMKEIKNTHLRKAGKTLTSPDK